MNDRIHQLKEFLTSTPEDPFLHYALTMEYLKQGDQAAALAGFERMLQQHADYVGTYYHFGKFLETTGAQDRAFRVYQQGMEVARAQRNQHALAELQTAYRMASGACEAEDDEDA